ASAASSQGIGLRSRGSELQNKQRHHAHGARAGEGEERHGGSCQTRGTRVHIDFAVQLTRRRPVRNHAAAAAVPLRACRGLGEGKAAVRPSSILVGCDTSEVISADRL
ncbi:uncharacterized protein Tco025E_06991, partial [Trypanosoma conorhini]